MTSFMMFVSGAGLWRSPVSLFVPFSGASLSLHEAIPWQEKVNISSESDDAWGPFIDGFLFIANKNAMISSYDTCAELFVCYYTYFYDDIGC